MHTRPPLPAPRAPCGARARGQSWVWALAGAICCLWAAPAWAGYVCTDEWGRSHAMAQPVASGLSKFVCRANAAVAVPAKTPSAQDAALALGLTTPALRSPVVGRMVLLAPDPRTTAAPPPGAAAERFDGLIAAAARRFDHDVGLLRAIVHVESRFNPNAVSPKGAIGLMQVMPQTARGIGVRAPETALFDPETNLLAGAHYLRQLLDRFPDRPDLAIAAYNAGEGAVMRYRRQIPPYPETQSYVRQVQAEYLRYRQP